MGQNRPRTAESKSVLGQAEPLSAKKPNPKSKSKLQSHRPTVPPPHNPLNWSNWLEKLHAPNSQVLLYSDRAA